VPQWVDERIFVNPAKPVPDGPASASRMAHAARNLIEVFEHARRAQDKSVLRSKMMYT